MSVFVVNIDKETLNNNDYRRVISTHKNIQVVLMSLDNLESIPEEVHANNDQLIKVVKGSISVEINNKTKHIINEGSLIVIPSGTKHKVINNSASTKLYTIYSPPEHPPNTLNSRQSGGKTRRLI